MPTGNERIQLATVAHLVDLSRYETGVVRRMLTILARANVSIEEALRVALARINPDTFTMERLEAQLASVRALNAAAYGALGVELVDELTDFAQYEAAWQASTVAAALPATFSLAAIPAEVLAGAANARPFQGGLLRQWISEQTETAARRMRQTVADGFTASKTTQEIVREVVGSRAADYKDGILQVGRREAESVVRTALSHTAGYVRDAFTEANQDLFRAVRWLSTLDNRTSEPCRIRDGLLYTPTTPRKPIGHKVPWLAGPGALHWCCRSTYTHVLDDEGLVFEGTRSSVTGPVPDTVTYSDWLKTRPASEQDEVLGKGKADLFRQDRITLADLYSARGEPLTLEQLRRKLGN
ncbi:MAG: hypothetical protein EON92_03450 [Burkholderiales bacterium]|nr:MAG: hypothetical protein EON92_03450 [Burkholderiales bacterium]